MTVLLYPIPSLQTDTHQGYYIFLTCYYYRMRIHIYTDEDAFIIKMEVYKLQTICCISSDYLFKYRLILLENNKKCMNIRYVHVALAIWEYVNK